MLYLIFFIILLGNTCLSDAAPRGIEVVEGGTVSDFVAAQTGKSWAVVIGIDEYSHLPPLRYAVADANAVGAEFRARGFEVMTLLNEQATAQAIRSELGDRLLAKVSESDHVVVFFAGHGETRKVPGGKEMGYLLPVEGDRNQLAGTSISMGLLRELSEALPSKHVLFLVDVCYGGIAGQQFRGLPPMTSAYLKTITRERGRQLISAGGADQQAMESHEWGHSVFTYYLLEGLHKGHADLNDDGIIPASELYSYLESRVFSAAQQRSHNQRPEIYQLSAERGEFVFFTAARHDEDMAQRAPAVSVSPSAKEQEDITSLQEQSNTMSAVNDPPRGEQDTAMLPPSRQDSISSSSRAEMNAVLINDVVLDEVWLTAFGRAGINDLNPGRYWYDEKSGLWGREGEPPSGKVESYRQVYLVIEEGGFLGFGGKSEIFRAKLKANASRGTTRVFINGRELSEIEVAEMREYLPSMNPGRYQLNRRGEFDLEGQVLGRDSLNLDRLKQAQLQQGLPHHLPYDRPMYGRDDFPRQYRYPYGQR